jgi:hypothetical protein
VRSNIKFLLCISHDEIQQPFRRSSPCALRKGSDHSVPEVPLVECTAPKILRLQAAQHAHDALFPSRDAFLRTDGVGGAQPCLRRVGFALQG